MPIRSSVGSGGKNMTGDVYYVQLMLNDWRCRNKLQPVQVDGIVGPETTGAIRAFQQRVTGIPDGRVDPDGPTLTRLEESHYQGILSGEWNLPYRRYHSGPAGDNPLARRAHVEYLTNLRLKLG